MAYQAKKTEHNGPKKGCGAYWGRKCEAKKESDRIRRRNGQMIIADELNQDSENEDEFGWE